MRIHVRVHRVLLAMAFIVLTSSGGGVMATAARAAACPNEQLREQEVYALSLPDCRAYEQVSPTDKGHADALGVPGVVQSSPSGDGVTYFSLSAFPIGVTGSAEFPTYLSIRRQGSGGAIEWSTQGLIPPTVPTAFTFTEVLALTPKLSKTIIFDFFSDPPLTPEATSGQENYYVRDNANGSYQLLASKPEFGASVADSTPDGSRILFESSAPLLPNAATGVTNLYEWDNGQLSVAGVLPVAEGGGVPAGGSVAGAGASTEHYTEHTISEDGSRVFFTDMENGRLYVRESGKTTIPVSLGPGHFRAATPDGRYVFYTDETGELWRFDVNDDTRKALASTVGGVIGILGVSNDGSYAYFVSRSDTLYEWHEGTPSPISIAGLTPPNSEGNGGDEDDWIDSVQGIGGGPTGVGLKSSLVAPDGRTVLFFKEASLFRYNAASGSGKLNLIASEALLGSNNVVTSIRRRSPFLTHSLSENGSRIFFETEAALVPQDTNGVMDVYEWDQEGFGTCERSSENFREGSGGCIYLISAGQSRSPSYIGDAGANGSDVFFFTRQPLVGQDQDNNVDVYDARVEGGIAAQNMSSPPGPCVSDACLSTPSSPPAFGGPSSSTFSGAGNLTLPVPKPATKRHKLAKALTVCRRKTKTKRAVCEALVRKKHGTRSKAKNAMRSAHARKTVLGKRS